MSGDAGRGSNKLNMTPIHKCIIIYNYQCAYNMCHLLGGKLFSELSLIQFQDYYW